MNTIIKNLKFLVVNGGNNMAIKLNETHYTINEFLKDNYDNAAAEYNEMRSRKKTTIVFDNDIAVYNIELVDWVNILKETKFRNNPSKIKLCIGATNQPFVYLKLKR